MARRRYLEYEELKETSRSHSSEAPANSISGQLPAVLGLCIGLRLSLDDAEEFLASGNYAFNPKDKKDELVKRCLITHQYDINNVNIMLFVCGLDCIGAIEEELMRQYL